MSFNIDTGADGGGSKGPWISFKPKGSAKHGLPYKSWTLRSKTDTGSTIEKFAGMETSGVVLDVYAKGSELCGSLKLGFSKSEGMAGVAPERKWFASPLRAEQRPDETKKATGGYVWTNALSIRAAIGGGKVATWEDDGWGVYKGFNALAKQISAALAANEGLCPMVKVTGYADEGQGTNTTSVPLFTILQWVKRPDCLKEDAPVIAAEPLQPSTPPPAAASVSATADF